MQNQHSISVTGKIRRDLPGKLISGVQGLDIVLVGEQTENDKGGVVIKVKGYIEVRGVAPDIHAQGRVISAVKEKSGGRLVKNFMSVKKTDRLRERPHGWF